MNITAITLANYSLRVEFRLYRNAVLLDTAVLERSVTASSGNQTFPVSNTFVDTAIATGANIYVVNVIVTVAANVINVTAYNRDINAIRF